MEIRDQYEKEYQDLASENSEELNELENKFSKLNFELTLLKNEFDLDDKKVQYLEKSANIDREIKNTQIEKYLSDILGKIRPELVKYPKQNKTKDEDYLLVLNDAIKVKI